MIKISVTVFHIFLNKITNLWRFIYDFLYFLTGIRDIHALKEPIHLSIVSKFFT